METLNLKKLPKGWQTGTVAEFLELTPEENSFIEIRLLLSAAIKQRRIAAKQTQKDLAKKLGTSQSRLAKMETGDSSVAIDLLVKGLVATGASAKDIGAVLTNKA